jgi:hypothetical protein
VNGVGACVNWEWRVGRQEGEWVSVCGGCAGGGGCQECVCESMWWLCESECDRECRDKCALRSMAGVQKRAPGSDQARGLRLGM